MSDWERYSKVGHRVGPDRAPVTLVEFVDYQCPACAVFAQTLNKVRAAHPNDLSIVYRHWPLAIHPKAESLARAAECADDQKAFEAYHNRIFELRDSLAILSMGQIGSLVGVSDTARFSDCARSTSRLEAIERDVAAAQELGARGTPTVLINNKRLSMVPDSARLEQLIRDAMDAQK